VIASQGASKGYTCPDAVGVKCACLLAEGLSDKLAASCLRLAAELLTLNFI
jgi:hypothetical protein